VRVLLDENIPVQLKSFLREFQARSVNEPAVGWKRISNGLLLDRMEGRFDVLVTADRSLYAQQKLAGRAVAVLVLPTNRRRDVLALGPSVVEAIRGLRPGDCLELPPPD
jgi:hypothetical protein